MPITPNHKINNSPVENSWFSLIIVLRLCAILNL
jgi:hypothetical protein